MGMLSCFPSRPTSEIVTRSDKETSILTRGGGSCWACSKKAMRSSLHAAVELCCSWTISSTEAGEGASITRVSNQGGKEMDKNSRKEKGSGLVWGRREKIHNP